MPITGVRDVATLAGVSAGTVSNYFNKPGVVSAETAKRIEKAVEALHYVPNEAGRRLSGGISRVVAHLTFEIDNPFAGRISEGATQRAASLEYALIIATSSGDTRRQSAYLDLFESQRVAGILISPFGDVEERVQAVRDRGIPIVFLDWHGRDQSISSVGVDDVQGGRLAAQHLVDRGHQHIVFVGDDPDIQIVRDRREGITSLVDATSGASLEIIRSTERTMRLGVDIGRKLFARTHSQRPTGLIGVNDLVALGLLHAAQEQPGFDVPRDAAVVGFDDIPFAADSVIPLTTIHRPAFEFGDLAMRVLHDAIAHPERPARHETFTPWLVQRASS
jgi:LacI family transcriptional regulator